MSAFDLVFALFGLLLGLALCEVLAGFARVLKLKRGARPVRIGWLTPLLGLFVMQDLTSFWGIAFMARDQMDASYLTLAIVLAITGDEEGDALDGTTALLGGDLRGSLPSECAMVGSASDSLVSRPSV